MKSRYLVHEFSRLTKVTVRTLHDYDHIGLLAASDHTAAGARLYSDKDLVRLQQIVTLKFMGFALTEIKRLLDRPGYSIKKALRIQARAVEEESARLRPASRALHQTLALLDSGRGVSGASPFFLFLPSDGWGDRRPDPVDHGIVQADLRLG